jgi:Ca2+-transporting ATPase
MQRAPAAAVSARYGVDAAVGLSTTAQAGLARGGTNRLMEQERESLWASILEEIREPMILLLLGTGVLYGLWSNLGDALIIFAITAVVVGVEIYNERRAERAIATLAQLAESTAGCQPWRPQPRPGYCGGRRYRL